MNHSKFSLSQSLVDDLPSATPGLRVAAVKSGGENLTYSWGQAPIYYDFASVTKVIFTVTAVMKCVDEKLATVEDPVQRYLPWFPSGEVTIKMLLGHYSGFEWWAPVYEMLRERNLVGRAHWPANWRFVQDLLANQKIHTVTKDTYSDLDFWTLGFFLEEVFAKPLDQIWADLKIDLQMEQTHFCIDNNPVYQRELYAPTEACPWRRKTLQGEVHDDNTWALGGVAPHAGLFGPIEDLVTWAKGLRLALKGGEWAISAQTVQQFAKRCGPGAWAHGFMMPSPIKSSVGDKMSRAAIGHWGFTGSGSWLDPDHDIIVATLANRVHPTRENKKFNDLRPRIHDEVLNFFGVK